ncbi:hypothetical protein Drorol1_Dr00014879 [Drosera rotundifolia]
MRHEAGRFVVIKLENSGGDLVNHAEGFEGECYQFVFNFGRSVRICSGSNDSVQISLGAPVVSCGATAFGAPETIQPPQSGEFHPPQFKVFQPPKSQEFQPPRHFVSQVISAASVLSQ